MRKIHKKVSPFPIAIVRVTEALLDQIEIFLAKRERARNERRQILNVQKLSAPAESRKTIPLRRMEP